MLFRFRAQQAASLGIIDAGRTRRPRVITEVESIPVCEKWRGQVLKEISRKVSRIQESSLSDFQIRDLNDEINKAMREKHMWEVQIRSLGGPNYMRGGGKVFDEEGREIPGGGKGYRYGSAHARKHQDVLPSKTLGGKGEVAMICTLLTHVAKQILWSGSRAAGRERDVRVGKAEGAR